MAEAHREEIAGCSERAYESLSVDDARKLMLFASDQEAAAFAEEVRLPRNVPRCLPRHLPVHKVWSIGTAVYLMDRFVTLSMQSLDGTAAKADV